MIHTKIYFFLVLFVFILAIFLRFYKLGVVPNGLNQDELALGYNAYSIMQTGKDEYGTTLPLYFKSFGDQKLPVYVYGSLLPIKLWGLNAFSVRFLSAFLGSVSVILLYYIILLLSRNTWLSLLTAFFLTINPWHLFFSRAAFEDNIALSFVLFGLLMFILALNSKYRITFSVLSILGFSLSLYSYNVTRLLAPLLLAIFIFVYRQKVLKMPQYVKTTTICIFILALVPFFSTIFSVAGAKSAGDVLITSADSQAKYIEWRSYMIHLPQIISTVLFNKFFLLIWQYMQNIISFVSPTFFFISGSTHGTQGIGNIGMFYLFELPTILIGIVIYFKSKITYIYPFFLWTIIALLVASLSKEVPHATRGYFLVIPLTIFSAYGFYSFILFTFQQRNQSRILNCVLALGIICFSLSYYFFSYYIRFPILYASEWRAQDKELVQYVTKHQDKYDKVVFDTSASFMYISLLFYEKYSPQEFQKSEKRFEEPGAFSQVVSFGKYEFKKIDWSTDTKPKNVLLVTSSKSTPSDRSPLTDIIYPTRPVVFSEKGNIMQYPVTDTAYSIYTSNK